MDRSPPTCQQHSSNPSRINAVGVDRSLSFVLFAVYLREKQQTQEDGLVIVIMVIRQERALRKLRATIGNVWRHRAGVFRFEGSMAESCVFVLESSCSNLIWNTPNIQISTPYQSHDVACSISFKWKLLVPHAGL